MSGLATAATNNQSDTNMTIKITVREPHLVLLLK